MSAILEYQAGIDRPIIARSAVGATNRAFQLPIELSGLTMTINGAACGLRAVSRHRVEFTVPLGLASTTAGTVYPLVVNNNGVILRTSVTIVPARPDIYRLDDVMAAGGRAKVFNVTNARHTTEPFAIRTIMRKGNRLVPSVLRVYVTGVANLTGSIIRVRIRDQIMTPIGDPILIAPGIYGVDFRLPAALGGAGDQPIVVTVTAGGGTFSSRLDDTTSRLFIL
jgi:uncharacterized protein (TIGR03437 family)